MSKTLTASHWGIGVVEVEQGRITRVGPYDGDPVPSLINDNIPGSLNGKARVLRPAVRKGWLDRINGKPQGERGRDVFVEMSWDEVLPLIAGELTRVKTDHGNEAIYAGSYGWASAGRFHHAQSQLKRFLNTQGGFVRSEGNYSYNAALVLIPHITGDFRQTIVEATRWSVIARHSDLVVMFGGLANRNTQVSDGGVSKHRLQDNLKACADAGVNFANISPLCSDASENVKAQWLPPNPGSDTAVMMGLAHTLLTENLHDRDFLDRYTVGFDKVEAYLLGKTDGIFKDAQWASEQSDIEAQTLIDLARRMAAGRTMISTAAGVQRTDFGEQPLWMTITLAAMLGQIGLPGGGYTIGYGVNANIGNIERLFRWGAFAQGQNPVETFIPVAMVSEMLLNPGAQYPYDGETLTLPDIKLVWWAGGNPFHHHQNLNKLHEAFQAPETIIVNEINWTATAQRADIVLPVAAPQERTDFGAGRSDNALIPMPKAADAPAEALSEYEIFTWLAALMGEETDFTEGRSEEDWLREIWAATQANGQKAGVTLPDWDTFITGDMVSVPDPSPEQVFMADFRADPDQHPLTTPSGKIELFSETIAGFNLDDCPGHAAWFPPRDLANGEKDTHPLYLLSGQPKTRLHSQLDNGEFSMSHKISGREPVIIHPDDAAERGIADGDIVELFNARGRCLAGARVSDEIRKGCVFLWTGAWYDPDFDAQDHRCRHGNPNVLTHDERTSSLSQSPAAHSALIDIRKFTEKADPVRAHEPPQFIKP